MSETVKWYEKQGENNNIVVSSRIRLARNLRDFPFVNRMNEAQKTELADRVWDALSGIDLGPSLRLSRINMIDIPHEEALWMAERHLISPQFAKDPAGHVLLLSEDESLSIMLCEEDHIRIQVLASGLCLEEALQTANDVDDLLDERLGYAFDEKLGYLTECPTNLGTGLRASIMLHLPAIRAVGAIENVAATVSKLGLTIRGTYGEGSDIKGDFYQLSNQVTLGISEKSAITNLAAIGSQIIAQEQAVRNKYERISLEDRVWRAMGVLQNARLLSFDELCDHLSALLIGVNEGMITNISPAALYRLLHTTGAAAMVVQSGQSMTPIQRDTKRAEIVRNVMNQ